MSTTPYASTRLAEFIDQRIGELHHKTQADIAKEAGFRNANFITMLKTGSSKLAFDRVPSLAKALDVEPAFLMRLAIEQSYGPEMLRMFLRLLGADVSTNERAWISIIRAASQGTDPAPTARTEAAVREVFEDAAR
jgi:transcriptional regulator with XRE-family HTH domain